MQGLSPSSAMNVNGEVDSYRFLKGFARRMIKDWISLEKPRDIPWTPFNKPLNQCTVALISSAGLALASDKAFDREIEYQNPWFSDPSFRVIPRGATAEDVHVFHLHINPEFILRDINCALPVERLQELEASGAIGRAAPSHYSYIGYTCQPDRLLDESVPAIIEKLRDEAVDVVVLVPA
jgi:D-proline reductase (dithiol) PrdB